MEDEESGSLSFNSSDGGSRSWSPSPSHKTNQHVSNREGLHFLPLNPWPIGKVLSFLAPALIVTQVGKGYTISVKVLLK